MFQKEKIKNKKGTIDMEVLKEFWNKYKGAIIGVIIAFIRNNYDTNDKMKLANKIAKLYVNIIRGTPVILQLMIIYYVIFKSVDINIIVVAVIAFGINSGAYVSEIIRAGINSIPKGH